MYRLIQIFLVCALIIICNAQDANSAWPWQSSKILLEINGVTYTPEDFRHWWTNWREPGMAIPESPDKFIEWKLLVGEAASMDLYNEDSFKHKLNVYLKARTRMILKYDEVDSKITVTDEEIERRYRKDYSPHSYVTTIYYSSGEEAAEAYEQLRTKTLSFEELLQKPAAEGGPKRKE
jgi:hypothetical protein